MLAVIHNNPSHHSMGKLFAVAAEMSSQPSAEVSHSKEKGRPVAQGTQLVKTGIVFSPSVAHRTLSALVSPVLSGPAKESVSSFAATKLRSLHTAVRNMWRPYANTSEASVMLQDKDLASLDLTRALQEAGTRVIDAGFAVIVALACWEAENKYILEMLSIHEITKTRRRAFAGYSGHNLATFIIMDMMTLFIAGVSKFRDCHLSNVER